MLAAYLISSLGGDKAPPAGTGLTPQAGATTAATQPGQLPASGLQTTQGIVPGVEGKTATIAKAAIQESGYTTVEKTQKSNEPKGVVITQSPAAGVAWPAGSAVTIVISDGP